MHATSAIQWVAPTYTAIHRVLTNPVYAGAYAHGEIGQKRSVDAQGAVTTRTRHLPIQQWAVLLPEPPPRVLRLGDVPRQSGAQ